MHLKKTNWDLPGLINQIHSISRECSSPYNDGFTAFELKKDLYQLKKIIDDALQDAPDFGQLEKDWLTDQEKKRIIKILKT